MSVQSMLVKSTAALALVAPMVLAAPTVAVAPPGGAGTKAASTEVVWEDPVVMEGATFMADPQNHATLVWGTSAGIMSIQRQADSTWSQPAVIATNPEIIRSSMVTDANGTITAVWISQQPGSAGGVMAAKKTAGSGWSKPVRISGDPKGQGGASELTLAVSPKGAAVVVWSTQNKPYRIRSVYHGPGRGWTHVVDVTQAAGSHHPQVGIAADGTVRLLYVHHPVGQPRSLLFRSRHPGEGWSNATTVAREGYAPSLAVDRAGDALVVFMPTWIGPVEAVYRPTGGRWGTAHRLSPDSAYSLAMNGRGTALVALAHEGGRVDLVRRPPHGPWSAPAWLSPADGSASDFVSVALNETGDTWVAWGQEVLHGRYRPSGGSWSSILTVAPDPGGEIEGVSSQVAPNGDAVVLYDNENAPRTMRAMTATP